MEKFSNFHPENIFKCGGLYESIRRIFRTRARRHEEIRRQRKVYHPLNLPPSSTSLRADESVEPVATCDGATEKAPTRSTTNVLSGEILQWRIDRWAVVMKIVEEPTDEHSNMNVKA